MLATAEELAGDTLVAVQASGNVRDDIVVGDTGVLSYADLYRIFPLGENPLDGSAGYPLTRFYIYTVELKAAFEVGASRGYIEDSLYLSAAGVKVEYDTSREPQDISSSVNALDPQNGRVTRILVDVDHTDGVEDYTVALFDIDRKVRSGTASSATPSTCSRSSPRSTSPASPAPPGSRSRTGTATTSR